MLHTMAPEVNAEDVDVDSSTRRCLRGRHLGAVFSEPRYVTKIQSRLLHGSFRLVGRACMANWGKASCC